MSGDYGIRFEVVKDRDYNLRFAHEKAQVPRWFMYILSLHATSLFWEIVGLNLPPYIRYTQHLIGIMAFVYILRVSVHSVVVETELRFKVTSEYGRFGRWL